MRTAGPSRSWAKLAAEAAEDAEGFFLPFEHVRHTGQGDNVGQGKETRLAQAEIERLGELRMLDGLGWIGVSAGIACGFAETEGDRGRSGGHGLPEIVDRLVGGDRNGNLGLKILAVPITTGEAEKEGDEDQQQGQDWVSRVVNGVQGRICRRQIRSCRAARHGVQWNRLGSCRRRVDWLDGRGWSGKRNRLHRLIYRFLETLEDRNVGAGGELDANLIAVSWIIVVLGETFADFAGRDPNDGIGVGVIAGGTAKNLHADRALLHLVGIAGQRLLDHKAQEGRVSFALGEKRMNKKQLKLSQNRVSVGLRLGHPWLQHGASCGTGVSTGLRRRILRGIQALICSETV